MPPMLPVAPPIRQKLAQRLSGDPAARLHPDVSSNPCSPAVKGARPGRCRIAAPTRLQLATATRATSSVLAESSESLPTAAATLRLVQEWGVSIRGSPLVASGD